MFEYLQPAPPDPILGLNEAFREDSNPDKINLSVGVFKDAQGQTPILKCVKQAERQLLEAEGDKAYLGMDGLAEFGALTRALVLGQDQSRAVTVQTPGGTGALRVAADFFHQRFPTTTTWLSDPTWANHPKVFAAADVEVQTYPYLDADARGLNFDAMCAALENNPVGDVVLLHACCHNPTGIDPTLEQWEAIADIVKRKSLIPLVDFAYQGFGQGLEEDAAGVRALLSRVPEAIICSSFSKNFGLYAERVGALTIVAESEEAAKVTLGHVKLAVRTNYSNPPKHGGAIVQTILSDPELRQQWEGELAEMRQRINGMRKLFVERMTATGLDRDFSFITQQNGMFSFSGLNPMQVDELRKKYAIYIVGSGRINVAGITEDNIERLCNAIAEVSKQ